MSRTLLWDAGPGEIRAGLCEDGKLVELHLIRLRRDWAHYAAGEIYTARVLRNLAARRAMVAIGGGREAVLQAAKLPPEGAMLAVEMIRAPIPEPGRIKPAVVRPAPDHLPQGEPAWHFSDEPWVLFLRRHAASLSEIVVPNAQTLMEVKGDLGSASPRLRIDQEAIAEADFDGLIEAAVTGEFPVPGGMLTIERTRALTAIDIDGGGEALDIALAAAREIPRLVRLLGIGGSITIDFPTLSERAQRSAIDVALAAACEALGPHERTAINGFGLAQVVRPRPGPSVQELLCGTLTGRLSLESRATALLREAGRSRGHGPRQLIASPAIIELIEQWPEETAALRFSLGTEIELVADPAATGYGHVHVSPA